jgi:hypothetical protein
VKPSDLAAFLASAAKTAAMQRSAPSGPIDPEPPFPVRTVAPSAPIPQQFRAGDTHTQGHNAIKENNRGLYCPTHLNDGTWCKWSPPR